jgi:hypothetical protein
MAKSRNHILAIQETLEFLEVKSAYGLAGVGAIFLLLKKLSDNKGAMPLSILPAIATEINFEPLCSLVTNHGIFQYNEDQFWYTPICPKPPKPKQQQQENFDAYDERTIQSFKTFSQFVQDNYPRVAAMEQPFAIDQYLKLVKQFNRDTITRILAAMNNHKPLHSKYVSAYLTARNWLQRHETAISPADQKLKAAIGANTTPPTAGQRP